MRSLMVSDSRCTPVHLLGIAYGCATAESARTRICRSHRPGDRARNVSDGAKRLDLLILALTDRRDRPQWARNASGADWRARRVGQRVIEAQPA